MAGGERRNKLKSTNKKRDRQKNRKNTQTKKRNSKDKKSHTEIIILTGYNYSGHPEEDKKKKSMWTKEKRGKGIQEERVDNPKLTTARKKRHSHHTYSKPEVTWNEKKTKEKAKDRLPKGLPGEEKKVFWTRMAVAQSVFATLRQHIRKDKKKKKGTGGKWARRGGGRKMRTTEGEGPSLPSNERKRNNEKRETGRQSGEGGQTCNQGEN